MPYILVLNLGLKSIRSIVFDESGKVVGKYWLPVRTLIRGQFVEQDPNEWWEQAMAVIKATLNEEVKDKVTHISVTSSSCCLVLLDENGNCLGSSLMVSDKRASEQAKRLKTDPDFSFLFRNQNHLPEPSYMFPKMMWLKENRPEIFKKVSKFMSSDDFLIYRLTGKFVTDCLNAEKFYYDQYGVPDAPSGSCGSYPKHLLQYLGVTERNLPTVVDIGTNVGALKDDVKSELGLKHDVHVVVSTYDAICAFWGAGVAEEGEVSHVCGTCSSFRVYSKRSIAVGNGILVQAFKNPPMHIIGGSNNIEGGVLEWAKNCFYGDSYPLHDDAVMYSLMEEEAKQSVAGAHGLIFLPFLLGERVPFWDPNIRGVFFGLERNHTRKDIMRSIFESTGFNSLNMLCALEKSGIPVKSIRISGGLSRLEYICRLKADITGKELLVLDEYETTAIGAFMITAVTAGLFPDLKSAVSVVKVRKVIKPDLEVHKKYQKLYELYLKLYKSASEMALVRKEYLDMLMEDKYSVITHL